MSQSSEQPVTHEIGKRTYVVAEVDPLDVDGVRTVAVGTGLWLVVFVALLPFYGRLREDGHLWWLWTCLAGFGLGLAGWDFCRRRRAHRLDELDDPDDLDEIDALDAWAGLARPVETADLHERRVAQATITTTTLPATTPVEPARTAIDRPTPARPPAPTRTRSPQPARSEGPAVAATTPEQVPRAGRPPGPTQRSTQRPPRLPPALVADPEPAAPSEGTPVSVPPTGLEDATRPSQPQARQKPPFTPR